MKSLVLICLQSLVREEIWKAMLVASTTTRKKCPLSKIRVPLMLSSSKFMSISTILEITARIQFRENFQQSPLAPRINLWPRFSSPTITTITTPLQRLPHIKIHSKTIISFLLHFDIVYFILPYI